ncbi:hypothetical protein G9A89_021263 [Geosiphon pyriformis]|nr:hypothetical protein G9A89_021263 [Geosiphon pyriformis]
MIAAKWLVFMGKNSVRVALAVGNKQIWILRDYYRALLYILPIGTTVHNLSKLLASYGRKTCFIGHNLVSYAHDRCAVFLPVFRNVNLRWAGFFLVCCAKCDQFGYVSDDCSVGGNFGAHGKWVVASSSFFHVVSSSPLNVGIVLSAKTLHTASASFDVSGFNNCLASLECFLELVVDQMSDLLKKLSSVDLVPLPLALQVSLLVASTSSVLGLVLDMTVDSVLVPSTPSLSDVDTLLSDFSPSSLKVLTTKVCSLELKIVALEVSICLVLARLDPLGSGLSSLSLIWKFVTCNVQDINIPAKQKDVVQWYLSSGNVVSIVMETKLRSGFDSMQIFMSGIDKGYTGAGVAVIMNDSLACHISKLLVIVLGLYAGASAGVRFDQASEVNFLIAKAVNFSTFVVLGGNFNKDRSGRSVNFKFCLNLDLVNSFADYSLAKTVTWNNSREIERTIDYIFISGNLALAVADYMIGSVSGFFNTDYKVVIDVDGTKWAKFRDCATSKLLLAEDTISDAEAYGKIDNMWIILEKMVVESADEIFSKQ